MTSPSRTMYSLPSSRSLPASRAPASPLQRDEVLVGDDLGADEAALEVGVDHAGGLRRGGAGAHGPGAHFLRAGGEIGLQPEQLVARRGSRGSGRARARPRSSRNSRARPPRAARSRPRWRRTPRTTIAPSVARALLAPPPGSGLSAEAGLVDVGDVHHRLQRQQVQLAQRRARRPRRPAPSRAPACPGSSASRSAREQLARGAARPCRRPWRPWRRAPRPSPRCQVGERQLGVDDLDVGQRIDAAGDVHDVVVLEAAHHVRDRIGLADVREELVAEALALRGAGHQAGDVDELDRRRHDLLRAARCRPARPGADPAPARRRRSDRWCRTDSSPPRSARASAR